MNLKTWIASLLLAFTPAIAGAVTLDPTVNPSVSEGGNTSASFSYEHDGGSALPFRISGFIATFNNSSSLTTLNASSYTFTPPGGPAGTPVNLSGTPTGTGSFFDIVTIPSFTILPGESFTFAYTLAQPGTSASFSFDVAPIPLPAAGWMLLSALGGTAFLSRRRKKAAAA
jgi:hypothetical protein